MRIQHKQKPEVGQRRKRTAFVWYKRIGYETRILETATWEEEYQEDIDLNESAAMCSLVTKNRWVPIRWLLLEVCPHV